MRGWGRLFVSGPGEGGGRLFVGGPGEGVGSSVCGWTR